MNFKLDFLFSLRNFRFDGFQAEVTSFSYIKCKKIIKEEEEEEEEAEEMDEVKDENFKHSTYILNNIVI